MTKLCILCGKNEAEYLIKKTPVGKEGSEEELFLCGGCASNYIKHDTVSIVRISKNPEKSKD